MLKKSAKGIRGLWPRAPGRELAPCAPFKSNACEAAAQRRSPKGSARGPLFPREKQFFRSLTSGFFIAGAQPVTPPATHNSNIEAGEASNQAVLKFLAG